MEKAFVAQRVAKKLFVTEAAVDGALVEASELMSEMLKARKDVNTSLVFADDAQVRLMEAVKALSEARTAMVGVHVLIGIGEALITALTVSSVLAVRPDLVYGARGLAKPLQIKDAADLQTNVKGLA